MNSFLKAHKFRPQREGSRQIHLDFHTSELISDIGEQFSKKQFQEALQMAKVNSINLFAKCHHGWCYYDTQVGQKHPHLKFDLLQQQIEACHEIGVRAQGYITVGWSAKDAQEHPEWVVKDKQGRSVRSGPDITPDIASGELPLPFCSWDMLTPEGDYLELILNHVKELTERYDLDGYWFDIVPVQHTRNFSASRVQEMKALGLNPDNPLDAEEFHIEQMEKFMQGANDIILNHNPNASIFYNWTTHFSIKEGLKYKLERFNTKFDLEDLPTTWDGYDLFPLRVKYYANYDKECVAMSGKFHTAWGEFGGFKHKEAILYEAASMVAFGAKVNFGDQLHPSGKMDLSTYENIGYAYDYVEKIEDYGVGGDHIASTGLWFANNQKHDEGTVKMLLENQVNFVIANNLADWSLLEVIILSGGVNLTKEEVQKIQDFLDNGGKLLVMGKGALDPESEQFYFDLGADYIGEAEFDIDYTVVSDALSENLVKTPFLNYLPSLKVKPHRDTEVLAYLREPYFNRRINAYSSHQHTPYRLENADHPSVIRKGNIVFITSPLGQSYFDHGARVHRELFFNCLELLRTNPLMAVKLPSSGRVNLLHQPNHNRYVAHVLYGTPHQRGEAQVIEDLLPIYNTLIKLNLPKPIKKVYCIPDGQPVNFEYKNGGLEAIIPEFRMHTALVMEY
ncbi:alpha-amylase family protein [Vibrio aphrogenes]|uniref:hypothetical protein n=1 Tax=Vibrio aphrogenes TaxID=1891186 RepID=UPI000B34C8D9|nr:hypothetical protein [Vibrio aphrogenes]